MNRVGGEVTLDHIDAWFQLGKEVPKLNTVTKSKLKGNTLDPATGEACEFSGRVAHIPSYKRNTEGIQNQSQTAYARHYKTVQNEQLIKQEIPNLNLPGTSQSATGGMQGLEEDTISMVSGVSQVQLPEDMTEEQANQVYANYNFRHEYNKKLPIVAYRDELVKTIENNQVTVVEGPTGSGKTTQVPQFILDHYASIGKYCNIIVTQPRRIAAKSIAKRVCSERGWDMGTVCGYHIGRDPVYSPDTRLTYVTTGVLLQKLVNTKNMHAYTHVILDEVHERDEDTDFCLLVVKQLLHTNSKHVKVVLMSATIESNRFAQYYALPIRGVLEPAPVVKVEGRMFTVREFYIEHLVQLGPLPRLHEDSPGIEDEAYNLAKLLILNLDKIDFEKEGLAVTSGGNSSRANKDGFPRSRGSVLVFLPGLNEIKRLEEELHRNEEHKTHKLKILPLHSTVTVEEQIRVFDTSAQLQGKRKVILSTNIAESSITVPDVKYVIDFCLTKNLVCDKGTNYTSLQMCWASKANCKQRKGRAGRVADGRVYRMVTRSFFNNKLEPYSIPEMERCPLEKLVLSTKLLDMGEPKAILGLALSPPNLNDIERTILVLKEAGALASLTSGEVNPHDGELTFLGRVLAKLPVDIHVGKLLVMGHVFGVLSDALIMGAALSLKSIFRNIWDKRLDTYRCKLSWSDGTFSDCIAMLKAYKVWEQKKARGDFTHRPNGEAIWGFENFLQTKCLNEVYNLRSELESRLVEFNIRPNRYTGAVLLGEMQEKHYLILKLVMCAAFYPNYFTQGTIDEKEAHRFMSGKNPNTTVMVRGLPQNQGHLYKTSIENAFKTCQTEVTPRITFEESKAYIEFTRTKRDFSCSRNLTSGDFHDYPRNNILLPVYLAIKMRELRDREKPVIYLDEDDVAKQQMNQQQLAQRDRFKQTQKLCTNRIKAVSDGRMRYETADPSPSQVALPGPESTFVPIFITEVLNCGHFWAYYAYPDTIRKIDQLQYDINRYQGQNLRPLGDKLQPGTLCIAPFEGEFFRARVNLVQENKMAEVFYVDYGNVESVPVSELRDIDPYLLETDFQSVEFELVNIKPSAAGSLTGRFTEEATNEFVKMIREKTTLKVKVYSVVHGALRVHLYDQTADGTDVCINDVLIEQGLADFAEESYVSKENHRLREDQGKESSYLSRPTSNRVLGVLEDVSDEVLPPLKDRESCGHQLPNRGRPITLNGPHSPLEMRFYSMTSISRDKAVRIEQDSVNSVALDNEPHDTHSRLMVAAHVGLNPSKSSMTCRDTTLLPNIHGLPQLVALLFCPKAELRCDREKKRYTGALCGLGWDPETGCSAFADHDMEIVFDTKFTNEDLLQVNYVRQAINIVTDSEQQSGDGRVIQRWGPQLIKKVQDQARQELLKLILQTRPSMEPEHFPNSFLWQQVPDEDILMPSTDQDGDVLSNETCLLNLHNGISLRGEPEEQPELSEEEKRLAKQAKLREHVTFLHSQANRSTAPEEFLCELCKITCYSRKQLMLHLGTMRHRQEEANLL